MSNTTTILVVEDEAIIAADLADKLRQLGYEVAGVVADGEKAVTLSCSLRPHLVLMDIRLEGRVDGIEAAETIRRLHDIPVVYLTAHSDPATLARAKLTGPFGYILKPFEERELATQIEMALYRHQADMQLRQQREWLRVTLTSIGDAVIATDAAGLITFLNPVAESLTGWKTGEAVGQPLPDVFRIINERTGQALEEPVARVLREGRAVALANHAALVTRDGRVVPIEDSAAPILDATGQVIGAVLVFHDVTEKRRAEEALRKSHDDLELRVRERTADLRKSNEALRLYTTMLEQSNRDLEDFAHVASHDLQEPVRKIQTLTDRLSSLIHTGVDNRANDYLDRVQMAARRMQELVLDLLKYARVTSNPEPFTRFNLRIPVDEAVTDLAILCEEMEGRVEVGELPEVEADHVQMRQLFQNLIGNGLKYRGEEKPVIRIYSPSSNSGRFRVIHVEDNGIGFDECYLDRIFKPFQRLHGRSAPYPGTGMGLAICRRIVERHGWTITAKSTPGEGSTFIIALSPKPGEE